MQPDSRGSIGLQGARVMIVVTGANGFIGSNVVARLNECGQGHVVAVDRFEAIRSQGCAAAAFEGIRYLDRMNVEHCLDMDDLPNWLIRNQDAAEAVLHIGACSDTTQTDRDYMMANNLEYTRTLWQWCTEAHKPFVYASSAATYGDGALGYDDQVDQVCYRPMNLYGESKHLFDLWALEQDRTPPRWAGLKYFNVYGPNEFHKQRMASMAYHWFNQIRTTGEARLFESYRPDIAHGDQQRDFIYVADAVKATLHLLATPASVAAPNGLYNVGTGTARTFADLARAVFAALELEPRLIFIPMPEDLRDQYQYFTQAQVAKLRTAGFADPFKSIEQGVEQYVRTLLAQERQSA